MSGGDYLRLHTACEQRGLRLGLAVGSKVVAGARTLKKLTVRGEDGELLVSVEIKRSLDKASRAAFDALKSQRF